MTWYEILPRLKSNSGMISYQGLDGFPPGGMFSYRVVGNQTTLVGFLTGRLDFIPDPLVGLDVAVRGFAAFDISICCSWNTTKLVHLTLG